MLHLSDPRYPSDCKSTENLQKSLRSFALAFSFAIQFKLHLMTQRDRLPLFSSVSERLENKRRERDKKKSSNNQYDPQKKKDVFNAQCK